MKLKSLFEILLFFLIFNIFASDISDKKFNFSDIEKEAETLAKNQYSPEESVLPDSIRKMTYNQYANMWLKPEHILWQNDNLHYKVTFFPQGYIYDKGIAVYQIKNDSISEVPFKPDYLEYAGSAQFAKDQMPNNACYAGFKILYKSPAAENPSEYVVFLGASYFRLIADSTSWGLSSRGISVNSSIPGLVEEFPVFEKFWFQVPSDDSLTLTLYALLDGESVTGAYRFDISPGETTTVEVEATLFFRKTDIVLGIAPLTSMFWFSSYTKNHFYDFRPQVHNSNGMILNTEKNSTWQPLTNYHDYPILLSDHETDSLLNYGLYQRGRDFNDYLDNVANYNTNPNIIVQPNQGFKNGKLRVAVIPTYNEWMDNVNAYWIPSEKLELKKPYKVKYTLQCSLSEQKEKIEKVKMTNIGNEITDPASTLFVLSFTNTNEIKADALKVVLDVPKSVNIHSKPVVENIPQDSTIRVSFQLKNDKLPPNSKPYPIQCYLEKDGSVVSEQWYYEWYPQPSN